MKKIIALLTIFVILLSPALVDAHFGGIPVIKINDKQTEVYTQEEYMMVGDFSIPSDVGAENYLVNKPVEFEVDKDRFPYPEEVVDKANYTWDFGDGQKATGEKVQYKYNKIGSYNVTLAIDFPDDPNSDFNQSGGEMGMVSPLIAADQQQFALIHIVPNKDYKIPKIIISLDGREISDPKGRLELTFHNTFGSFLIPKSISFDASKSNGSSKIKEYLWSFDGDKTSKKAKTQTTFQKNFFAYEVGVRVVDENNFSSAAFFTLYNPSKMTEGEGEEKIIIQPTILLVLGTGIIIGLGIFGYFLIKKNGKKARLDKGRFKD